MIDCPAKRLLDRPDNRRRLRRLIAKDKRAGYTDAEIAARHHHYCSVYLGRIEGTPDDRGPVFNESYLRASDDAVAEELANWGGRHGR